MVEFMKKGNNKSNIDSVDLADLAEFGVTQDNFLKIQSVNQFVNLKKLKSILRETNLLISCNISTLSDVIHILEQCLTVGVVSEHNRARINNGVDIFKDSLVDLVWNVDTIINDIEHGKAFKNECDIAEIKVIQIIEIINEANNCFDSLQINGVDLAYDEIERIIESLVQIGNLFNTINEIYEKL